MHCSTRRWRPPTVQPPPARHLRTWLATCVPVADRNSGNVGIDHCRNHLHRHGQVTISIRWRQYRCVYPPGRLPQPPHQRGGASARPSGRGTWRGDADRQCAAPISNSDHRAPVCCPPARRPPTSRHRARPAPIRLSTRSATSSRRTPIATRAARRPPVAGPTRSRTPIIAGHQC